MSIVVNASQRPGGTVAAVRAFYPVLSKMALRCRGALGATSGFETAPPPSRVILELPVLGDLAAALYASDERPARARPASGEDLSGWARAVASVPAGGSLTLAGREPLLSPFFEEVLFEADRREVPVSVQTSGERLEELAPLIYALNVACVRIVLHGPEDVHNRVALRDDAFEEAARGAIALKVLASGAARPRLVFEIPVSPANHGRLEDTVGCARAMGADRIVIKHSRPGALALSAAHVWRRGEAATLALTADRLDVRVLISQAARIAARWPHGEVRFAPHLAGEEIASYYIEAPGKFGPKRCFVPWQSVTIDSRCAARICGAAALGELGGRELEEIFNTEPARALRRKMRRGLAATCGQCSRRFGEEHLK